MPLNCLLGTTEGIIKTEKQNASGKESDWERVFQRMKGIKQMLAWTRSAYAFLLQYYLPLLFTYGVNRHVVKPTDRTLLDSAEKQILYWLSQVPNLMTWLESHTRGGPINVQMVQHLVIIAVNSKLSN